MKKDQGQKKKNHNSRIAGIYNTAEWFITAISVTLVFIVFQMQAYTIPTGSMADTLRGAHFRLRCTQCAYRFDYNFHPQAYGISDNKTPGKNVPVGGEVIRVEDGKYAVQLFEPRCPNCGYYQSIAQPPKIETGQLPPMPVMKGDRIFVLKCIYQFKDPKRWDVTVFKNPTEPNINYIKRMIGLPGETVEIIDGDIYIDGKIARKPDNVQKELWMNVYNNNYQPIDPRVQNRIVDRTRNRFNGHKWKQPFVNEEGSNWNLNGPDPTTFTLDSDTPDDLDYIYYDTDIGSDFSATYAYDNPQQYPFMPVASDLKIRFYVTKSRQSIIGAELSKYGIRYRAGVEYTGTTGRMVLAAVNENGKTKELKSKPLDMTVPASSKLFSFANVDHQLIFKYGNEKITHDLGVYPDSAGDHTSSRMPRVAILGAGTIKLSHIAVFRDIHYLGKEPVPGGETLRAGQGNPFKLDADQFFVLGDNTPASSDSRYWDRPGLANNNRRYRMGTVPRDYLVGKAFFIYWPGPFKPFDNFIRIIPHIREMKPIQGG